MERIAFYGKGGIGKSTIAANLSACYAAKGRRVLHVGCDPKRDSSLKLLQEGERAVTVMDAVLKGRISDPAQIINRGRLGIDCIESGGPEAGVGCGGRGVSRAIEAMEELDLIDKGGYEVAIFDVLGDVVCGGFAAPLRHGFAKKIVIIVSEENMSLYAANNIMSAVARYAENGVSLTGLVANLSGNHKKLPEHVERFAKLTNTKVIATVPRSPLIEEADFSNSTVVETNPKSQVTGIFMKLADSILRARPAVAQPPAPLSHEQFLQLSRNRFADKP